MNGTRARVPLALFGLALLAMAMACSTLMPQPPAPTITPPPEAPPSPGGADSRAEVDWTDLEIQTISATGDGFTGPVLDLVVRNTSDREIEVVIPCGHVFLSDDASLQSLIVVQETVAHVGPGDEATLTAFVVCFDHDLGAPQAGSTYAPGALAEGQALELARCLCEEDLSAESDPFGLLGAQFAMWMTRNGMSLSEALAESGEAEGAMGELLGEQFGEEFAGVLQMVMTMIEAPAQRWLDRCGIEIEAP